MQYCIHATSLFCGSSFNLCFVPLSRIFAIARHCSESNCIVQHPSGIYCFFGRRLSDYILLHLRLVTGEDQLVKTSHRSSTPTLLPYNVPDIASLERMPGTIRCKGASALVKIRFSGCYRRRLKVILLLPAQSVYVSGWEKFRSEILKTSALEPMIGL